MDYLGEPKNSVKEGVRDAMYAAVDAGAHNVAEVLGDVLRSISVKESRFGSPNETKRIRTVREYLGWFRVYAEALNATSGDTAGVATSQGVLSLATVGAVVDALEGVVAGVSSQCFTPRQVTFFLPTPGEVTALSVAELFSSYSDKVCSAFSCAQDGETIAEVEVTLTEVEGVRGVQVALTIGVLRAVDGLRAPGFVRYYSSVMTDGLGGLGVEMMDDDAVLAEVVSFVSGLLVAEFGSLDEVSMDVNWWTECDALCVDVFVCPVVPADSSA